MKAAIKIFILFMTIIAGTWIAPQKASAQVSVSFQVFYDDLSPYGYWVDNPEYGYVWVPNVSGGFTPYGTNGYWVLTEVGWTWVSDYPWGWAPFHYGRWYADPDYGYMWIPGNEWGPGWVTWRRSEGYYGWAPIGPGISIDIAYSNGYNVPYNQWTFVRDRDFGRTNITNYYVAPSQNTTIINNSTVINNIQTDNSTRVKYNAGPDRTEVQKRTGTTTAPVAVREMSKPGQSLSNGELQTYRPRVQTTGQAGQKPAPSKVSNIKDVKQTGQRNSEAPPRKENQQTKEQPVQQQPSAQPVKQQSQQPERNAQPNREQPIQQQARPSKNTGGENQPQRKHQQNRQQPEQPQQARPTKDQPAQPQQAAPSKSTGGENQPQRNRQQNSQPRQDHPAKDQRAQPQGTGRRVEQQQPSQPQHSDQPARQQQPQQPEQANPHQPRGGENQPGPKFQPSSKQQLEESARPNKNRPLQEHDSSGTAPH